MIHLLPSHPNSAHSSPLYRQYGARLEEDTVSKALGHPNCRLNVTQKALASLNNHEQDPFIQVISPIYADEEYQQWARELAEEQEETYPTHFNVALGSVLKENGLFHIIGTQIMSLRELGGQLGDDTVWSGNAGSTRST